MTGMHNPAPPGDLLAGWLEDLDMSVTAFAAHVGISRVMLSRILHGHAAVTADMDLRLHESLLQNSPGASCCAAAFALRERFLLRAKPVRLSG